ncbi:Chloride conductance regulatory protein ICln [Plasmodiophora brassicae]|nr:hypothetical protein PBRA_004323 [Plasmodiophora brassicae]
MPLLRLYERSDSAAAPTPILALDEQIIQFQDGIRMVLGNDDLGAGSLYVTNRNVVWLSSDDERLGWSIDLPFVTLHAISTSGNEDFPGPWLLLQFDVDLDCEPDAISECRFVPLQESLALNSLYLSMCSAMQQTSSNAEHPEVKIGNDIGEHDMDEVDQEGQ